MQESAVTFVREAHVDRDQRLLQFSVELRDVMGVQQAPQHVVAVQALPLPKKRQYSRAADALSGMQDEMLG